MVLGGVQDGVTITGMDDRVVVMSSLQKPKRINLIGKLLFSFGYVFA